MRHARKRKSLWDRVTYRIWWTPLGMMILLNVVLLFLIIGTIERWF